MANPLFGVTAAARLDVSDGTPTQAAYFAMVTTYGFGTPVVYGVAPAALAVTAGVPLIEGATDPGINATVSSIFINYFPYGAPTVELRNALGVVVTTRTVSSAVGGGTLVGVNWTDPNGVLHADVDWQWNISVEGYGPSSTVAPIGKYQQAVVSWTGDGTANRLIPTPFSLAVAPSPVAIWGVGGQDGVGVTETNFFRHNAGMGGTSLAGINGDPVAAQGIMSFEAGGFRVTAGVSVASFANTAGVKYTAIVICDTTGFYLRVGSYMRLVGGAFSVNCVLGQTICAFAGGTPFDIANNGKPITDGFASYTFGYISPTVCSIAPPYARAGGVVGFTFTDPGATTVPSGTLTHAWVWGQSVAYKSTEFPGALSVSLMSGASGTVPFNDMITAVGLGGFAVAVPTNVNNSVYTINKRYDYMGLNANATFLAFHLFQSLAGVGAGAPPTVTPALGFTPSLAFVRQGNLAGFTSGGIFRAPFHTGTHSSAVANIAGTNNVINGITAVGVGTLNLGAEAAIAAQPYYEWSFIGGSVTVLGYAPLALPPLPPVFPVDPADPGPTPPADTSTGTNCAACVTLTAALGLLAARLQDSAMVHWTLAELTRYLNEAQRTWNALTGEHQVQATFNSVAQVPFYDLPTTVAAYRAYTITDTYMVGDLEYALMEAPTPAAWSGTAQFTLADLVAALQQRRDQFLVETGMVITRVVQSLAGPPASGRFTLNKFILTLRRLCFINAVTGVAYPLQRDDEWSGNAFDRTWPAQSGVPATSHPIAYSVGVTPPLQCQVMPPLSTTGIFDILAVTRAPVLGTGPCLDPAVGILLGVPDDWTWVVKWGALATLLGQQGVTYDPQRAAYCEARWRHGILLATKAYTVLAARINGTPCPINAVSEADQYNRSWQRRTGTPTQVLLAGVSLVALAPPPPTNGTVVTLDLVRNCPVPVLGADCLAVSEQSLEPELAYAQHLALFKEGPTQLQTSMDMLNRFFRAAGVNDAIDDVSSPNKQAIKDQTRRDEAQLPRILVPPPITIGSGAPE